MYHSEYLKFSNIMKQKKTYEEPVVEVILIDNEISLILNSDPNEPPGDPEDW